jgi:NLR family CARD domain-containing protein 3
MSFAPAAGADSSFASSQVRQYIHDETRLCLSGGNLGREEEAKQLAKELATNSTLEWLSLGQNNIGDGGVIALARALAANNSLTWLQLRRTRFGDAGMEALGQLLIQNETLQWLGLGLNRFTIVGLTFVANALKINKGLTWLDLSGNNINDAGAMALGDALRSNTSLSRLSLFRAGIGDEGAAFLLKALTECNTTMEQLSLVFCNFSPTIRSAIRSFGVANKAGIRLLHAKGELDLSSKGIDDAKARPVAIELAGNTTVTRLVLNQNEIGHQGCVDIADALIKNRVLTSIELNDNSVCDAGCSAMAATLLQNTMLTKILLNGNNVGVAGATALAAVLVTNTRLQHLGLGRNCIGNDGAVAIADALKLNQTLERLDLSGNNVTDEGTMAILDSLENYNCTLTLLNLENNADSSPVLQKAISFVLTSRLVLISFRSCLHRPLEKQLMPLVIHGASRNSTCHENPELARCRGLGAGPTFLLVRAAALNDSKVIKGCAFS